MLFVQILLPRFLVLELIFFFHLVHLHHGRACKQNKEQIKQGLKKGLADLANAGMKQILDANGVKYNSTRVGAT